MPNVNKTSKNRRILLAVSIMSLVCFLAITFSRGYFDGVNSAVNMWAASIQTHGLTQAANLINLGFDTTILLAVSLPMVGLLLYKGYIQKAGLLVGAMGADTLILQVAKTVIVSPRPLNSLVVEDSYSFPSGHLTTTIVFFGILTALAWQNRGTIAKVCLAAITPTAAVIVGFDRIYLNAHWLSDVVAAPFLALFVIATSILVMQYLKRWHTNRQTPHASGSKTAPLTLRAATLYGRAITSTQQTVGQ